MHIQTDAVVLGWPYNNKSEHFSERIVRFISPIVKGFENLQYISID